MKKLLLLVFISLMSFPAFSQTYFKDMKTSWNSTEDIMLSDMLDIPAFLDVINGYPDFIEPLNLYVTVNGATVLNYSLPRPSIPNGLVYDCCSGNNATIIISYTGVRYSMKPDDPREEFPFQYSRTYNITVTTAQTSTPSPSVISQASTCADSPSTNISFVCTNTGYANYRWRCGAATKTGRQISFTVSQLKASPTVYLSVQSSCQSYSPETSITSTLVDPPSNINTITNLSICSSDEPFTFANRFNIATGSWTLDQAAVTTVTPSGLSNGAHPGRYTISTSGCTFTKDFSVAVSVVGQPARTDNLEFCAGAPVQITVEASNSNTISWFQDAAKTQPISQVLNNGYTTNFTGSGNGDQVVYAEARSTAGCYSEVNAVSYKIKGKPSYMSNMKDFAVCKETPEFVLADYFHTNSGSWTMNATPVERINPSYLTPANYTLGFRIDTADCTFQEEFIMEIDQVEPPAIEVISEVFGQDAVYQASITDPQNILTQWFLDDELKREGTMEFTAGVANNPVYSVKLVTTDTVTGCSNFVVKNVTNLLKDLSFSTVPAAVNDTVTIQLGEHVEFQSQGAGDRFTMNWLFRDGFSYPGTSVYHYFNQPGTFLILCRITDQDTGIPYDYENVVVKVVNDNAWKVDLSQKEVTLDLPLKELVKIPYQSAGKSVINIAFYDKKGVYYFIRDFNIEGEGSLTIRNPLIGKPSGEYFLKIETFSTKTIIHIQKK